MQISNRIANRASVFCCRRRFLFHGFLQEGKSCLGIVCEDNNIQKATVHGPPASVVMKDMAARETPSNGACLCSNPEEVERPDGRLQKLQSRFSRQ
jgi:hypothetical protein